MKRYLVKYEDYGGDVHTTNVTGWDEQSAREQLINCKEIYWVRKIDNGRSQWASDIQASDGVAM